MAKVFQNKCQLKMPAFNKEMRAFLKLWIQGTYLESWQTSMMEIRYARDLISNPSRKEFTLLDYTIYLSPDEIFEPFV